MNPKEVSIEISINKAMDEKRYGVYRRNGKEFTRNYHRELKNGKGLAFSDLLSRNIFRENALLKHLLEKRVFE